MTTSSEWLKPDAVIFSRISPGTGAGLVDLTKVRLGADADVLGAFTSTPLTFGRSRDQL